MNRKNNEITSTGKYNSFAIVVPAHNEEQLIEKTLKSCDALDYPIEHYQVYVVADNCTDNTVEIVKKANAVCLERTETRLKGKGFALSWAFDIILKEKYDAILVLDADCLIQKNALQIFNSYMRSGHKVIQANYVVSNPDESPISYVAAIGSYIENKLFWAPKSDLNLPVFLRGTGMVFQREILKAVKWNAHSIVEDLEYSLSLLKSGKQIKFASDVSIYSKFPTSYEQLQVQRQRWADGAIEFGKSIIFKYIWRGLKDKKYLFFDIALTLLTLSRPFIILLSACTIVLAAICNYFYPGVLSTCLLSFALFSIFLLISYFLIGIIKLGLHFKRFYFLLLAPLIVLKLIVIAVMGFLGIKKNEWIRTPR